MRIIEVKATLKFNASELEMLANGLQAKLIDSIRGHYNKMKDKDISARKEMFYEQNEEKIRMMVDLMQLAGEGCNVRNIKAGLEFLFEEEIVQDVHPKGEGE